MDLGLNQNIEIIQVFLQNSLSLVVKIIPSFQNVD